MTKKNIYKKLEKNTQWGLGACARGPNVAPLLGPDYLTMSSIFEFYSTE